MKLEQLIAIADEVYPDGLVGQAFEEQDVGDGLAEFIARELKSTFEKGLLDKDQIRVAHSSLFTAMSEIRGVLNHLEKALEIAESDNKELPLLVGKYDGVLAAYLERRLKGIK